ncbi:hypothetical protein D3C87_187190 [compost metagenome]
MTTEEFTVKFSEIVNAIQNTNYGSVVAQLKLVTLIQEFYLTGNFNSEEIAKLIEQYPYEDIRTKAQDEVIGEIISNLNGFHSCRPIPDDFGDDYFQLLLSKLNRLHFSDTLFDECGGKHDTDLH